MAEEAAAFAGGAVLGYLLLHGKKIPILLPAQSPRLKLLTQQDQALAELSLGSIQYTQTGRIVAVPYDPAGVNCVSVVPADNKIKAITIQNLDINNNVHLRLGNPVKVSEGLLLPPQSWAFYSEAYGDTPSAGLWGIAENAPVNCECEY